jgi:hypothetical protein
MANYYIASDYAGINSKNLSVYYGYEKTMQTEDREEWCFEAKYNGKTVTIPFSKLGLDKSFRCECGDVLLRGISLMFDKVRIETSPVPGA